MDSFECEGCGKSFSRKYNRDKHMKSCEIILEEESQSHEKEIRKKNAIIEKREIQIEELQVEMESLKREMQKIIDQQTKEIEKLKEELIAARTASEIHEKYAKKPSSSQRKKLTSALRNAVWNRYIGEEKGKSRCFCCKTETISRFNFACGHVKAAACGGEDTLENLRPICPGCNSSMGTINMMEFIKQNGFEESEEEVSDDSD